jgi:hypothetical protein
LCSGLSYIGYLRGLETALNADTKATFLPATCFQLYTEPACTNTNECDVWDTATVRMAMWHVTNLFLYVLGIVHKVPCREVAAAVAFVH